MNFQYCEPLLNHVGQPLPIGRREDGTTVIASVGWAVAVSIFRMRDGDYDRQERLYGLAVKIDEQLQSSDPQPIEIGEDVSLREIREVVQADPELPAAIKIPAVRALSTPAAEAAAD